MQHNALQCMRLLHVVLLYDTARLDMLPYRRIFQIIAEPMWSTNLQATFCRGPLRRSRESNDDDSQAVLVFLSAQGTATPCIQDTYQVRNRAQDLQIVSTPIIRRRQESSYPLYTLG